MVPGQQQWQPSALLPDLASPPGLQQMRELREEAQKLPTDLLVVLVRKLLVNPPDQVVQSVICACALFVMLLLVYSLRSQPLLC